MKSFLFSLLPIYQPKPSSNLGGNRVKQKLSKFLLFWKMTSKRSPDALTVIQLLRLNFSNTLNHWLTNKKPLKLLSTVEGQPLPPVTVLGAIQMLNNFVNPVNKTDVPLHVLGGL